MHRCLTFIIVVVGLLVASTASAQTINACIKQNNGQLRVVSATEACLPSEMKISWKGDSGSGGGIRIVDATGTYIGNFAGTHVVNNEEIVLVTRQENGVSFVLNGRRSSPLLRGTARHPYYTFVYFGSWDCSGTPYVLVDYPMAPRELMTWGVPASNKASTGTETWVYYPIGSPQSVQMNSAFVDTSDCVPIGGQISGTFAEAGVVNLGVLVQPIRFGP
jgi:hypothetical protein